MTKKLGIVLPTFNRCEFLKMALGALLPQVERHKDDVTLVVCDNCSTDGTELFMRQFASEHTDVMNYYRHENNGGYLFNFKFGIAHVDAEYVFIHGDDDIVTPYFLDYIIDILNSHQDVDLFHFNYFVSYLESRPSRLIYPYIKSSPFIHKYETLLEFLEGRFDTPSFMSSNVFRKELWDKYVDDEKQNNCIAYEWLYIMYKGCENSRCLFLEMPIFVQRTSSLENYSSKWPLYSIVGIARVFEQLGEKYYTKWIEYRKNYSNVVMLQRIAYVCLDKKMYRKNYRLLSKYLYSRMHRIVLFISLYILPTRLELFIIKRAKRAFSK